MADETVGPPDRYPMPGVCMDGGRHWETRVYRFGSDDAPTFLCRFHIVMRIVIATYPNVPRGLFGDA